MQTPEAAVAIVRTPGPDSAILLMRRAEREGDAWSGQWSFPGGRRDESDLDLLDTALRELREEVGIRLSREQMSAALPPSTARRRSPPFLLVAPFVFDIDTKPATVLDPREAADAMWMPLRMLLDPGRHSFQRVPALPAEAWFPAIALPGAPLWGFTYRLLADWLQITPRDCASAGFVVARMVLDFLQSRGSPLLASWQARMSGTAAGRAPAHVAEVGGSIPVESVIERFSQPGFYVSHVNRLDIQPGCIRIQGLTFEEYVIEAVTD